MLPQCDVFSPSKEYFLYPGPLLVSMTLLGAKIVTRVRQLVSQLIRLNYDADITKLHEDSPSKAKFDTARRQVRHPVGQLELRQHCDHISFCGGSNGLQNSRAEPSVTEAT
jgi:hypothetical protein